MSNEAKLMLLRVQLFTAMQTLKGEELKEFWQLIDELIATRDLFLPSDESTVSKS